MLLLVDAQEGPKPQTRFVLKKALNLGLRVLVVVNKIDKPASRPDYVIDKTFDLFCELGASDEQTDFPVVYTSAINRIAGDGAGIASLITDPDDGDRLNPARSCAWYSLAVSAELRSRPSISLSTARALPQRCCCPSHPPSGVRDGDEAPARLSALSGRR